MSKLMSYTGGKYMLQIGGENCGFVKSVDGGAQKANVAEIQDSGSHLTTKHVSTVEYTPFKATVGISEGAPLYKWIRSSFGNDPQARDGAITIATQDFKAREEITFHGAYVSEFKLPKLDATSKETGFCEIGWEASNVAIAKGGGQVIKAPVNSKQKSFSVSNFRLEIDGLETTTIKSIDALTFTQKLVKEYSGELKFPVIVPGRCSFSNLKLTLSHAEIESWEQWAKSWFSGQSTEPHEKSGSITLLSHDLKTELARVNLFHIGLISLTRKGSSNNDDAIKTFDVECYLEKAEFEALA